MYNRDAITAVGTKWNVPMFAIQMPLFAGVTLI